MKQFKNILCLVDISGESPAGLDHAIRLAEQHQARLTVLHVLEPIAPNLNGFLAGRLQDLEAKVYDASMEALDHLVAAARPPIEVHTQVIVGTPFMEVIREVLRGGFDLLVKSVGGEGGARFLGGTDRHLLRKCPCPVWLVKSDDAAAYRRILAAVDFDPADISGGESLINRQLLETAASLAVAGFSQLHVVHAWEAIAENVLRVWSDGMTDAEIAAYVEAEQRRHEEGLHRLMTDFSTWIGAEAFSYLSPQRHLVRGAAHEQVPALAQRIGVDLVVMGTLGRTGVPGLIIGNTAETILDRINSAVLAVKPAGFVSPVPPG